MRKYASVKERLVALMEEYGGRVYVSNTGAVAYYYVKQGTVMRANNQSCYGLVYHPATIINGAEVVTYDESVTFSTDLNDFIEENIHLENYVGTSTGAATADRE